MTRFLCIAAATLTLTSCLSGSKDSCSATVLEPVQAVSGPKTIAVNQKANFLVTYLPQVTCSKLETIYEAAGSTPNTYLVGPRVTYTDCNCPANTVVAQATYSFTPTKAGTYYLNFISTNANGFIADTLVVQ
jgi:cytochrome c oxidase assembly protein Cox11